MWTCTECGTEYACESAAETCADIDNGDAYQNE